MVKLLTLFAAVRGSTLLYHVARVQAIDAQPMALHDYHLLTLIKTLKLETGVERMFLFLTQNTVGRIHSLSSDKVRDRLLAER